MVELYASGFNAWNQLSFGHHDDWTGGNVDDFRHFTCILRSDAITQVQALLSYTILKCNGITRLAGCCTKIHAVLRSQDPTQELSLAEASNESVATIDRAGAIHQFSTFHDLANGKQGQTFPDLPACAQVIAYETGFAALTSRGSVYTWGDERYGACLGREISEDDPAGKPGLVTALQDLPTGPIAKIAAGGYMLAALTTGNDLYLWGGHPGRKTVPVDVMDEPAPVVIEELDIADIAIGEAHLIALTTDGKVFVIGDNGNGQLGLPIESTDSWKQVDLNLQEDRQAIGVAAGPRNSFITIKGG
ncbi:unnamed protein product [Discula destructiva]